MMQSQHLSRDSDDTEIHTEFMDDIRAIKKPNPLDTLIHITDIIR